MDIVEMLMNNAGESNMDINAKDVNNETAYHHASRFFHDSITKLFLKHSTNLNIDLDALNNEGQTANDIAKIYLTLKDAGGSFCTF